MGVRVLLPEACKAGLCLFLLWGPPRPLSCPVACDGRAEGTAPRDPGQPWLSSEPRFPILALSCGPGLVPSSRRLTCKRAISAPNTSWGKCWRQCLEQSVHATASVRCGDASSASRGGRAVMVMVTKAREAAGTPWEGQAAARWPLGALSSASPARPSGTPAQVLRAE